MFTFTLPLEQRIQIQICFSRNGKLTETARRRMIEAMEAKGRVNDRGLKSHRSLDHRCVPNVFIINVLFSGLILNQMPDMRPPAAGDEAPTHFR